MLLSLSVYSSDIEGGEGGGDALKEQNMRRWGLIQAKQLRQLLMPSIQPVIQG